MDNSDKKPSNYQQKSKIWFWIALFAVLTSLITGSLLLHQWWQIKQNPLKIQQKEQTLAQLEPEQISLQQQYQAQKNWINLTS